MRNLAWMLIFLLIGSLSYAQEESSVEIQAASGTVLFRTAANLFSQGKYEATVEELKHLEEMLKTSPSRDKQGFIQYWKGISYNRLQNFPEAITSFKMALSFNYAPIDIHYELGQALYAAEKLQEARLQFRESVRRKFKRGVSLYYIAFISKELGERKKAYAFFKSINKLSAQEAAEVRQASEMQIADLYLEQVTGRTDAYKSVEAYVIPQYEKALPLDPNSTLAPMIQEKIRQLQQKYDLVLFELRNGRSAVFPAYFLRLTQEIGQDDNVIFSPSDTFLAQSEQESLYSRTDVIARHVFYYRDYISIAPELRLNYTRFFNRDPAIIRNDNYLIAPSVRTAYEYSLWKKPAALMFDYDFAEARRDVEANENLVFSSRIHTLTTGNRFNFFQFGETIFRLRHRLLENYIRSANSTTSSFILEQLLSTELSTFVFFLSYDRMRVEDSVYDTDSYTVRTDMILPRLRDWFTPSIGMSLTSTDPINARETRGRELLLNPNARIMKIFNRNWRGTAKYEFQRNLSHDERNFEYKKSIIGAELEYVF